MERVKVYRDRPFVLVDYDFQNMFMSYAKNELYNEKTDNKKACKYIKELIPYMDYNTLATIRDNIVGAVLHSDNAEAWLDLKNEIEKRIKFLVEINL